MVVVSPANGLNNFVQAPDNSREAMALKRPILRGMNCEANATELNGASSGSLRLLSRVQAGMVVRVKRLMATPDVCQRLREIGLNEDTLIRLVARQASFICQVRNARLAFSETLANQILVESLDPSACR